MRPTARVLKIFAPAGRHSWLDDYDTGADGARSARAYRVLGIAILLLIAGIYSFSQLDIEAYPDPVQPMIEILTLPNGLSAEEVEKLITVPTEFGLGGMPQLADTAIDFALRTVRHPRLLRLGQRLQLGSRRAINQLSFISLPQGMTPQISPENPIGEIYRYTVQGPDHDLMREKEVEDWILEKQIRSVPGVIDVSGFGGLTKEYHVDVDPNKLNYYQVPLSTLLSSISNANTNAGGNYLTVGEQAFDVRGLGFIHSLDDIRNIVLSVSKATPVRVENVADVDIGYAPRLGIVGMNNQDEVVTGIVLMRKYGNTLQTLKGVEAKVGRLNSSGMMPAGYKVAPYYDRTGLVDTTLRTVLENLTVGMALVFLVLVFFLGNMRAAIIAAINIPLALCGAFTLMHVGDTPANLISLGAIDFGIIIDTTVIVIENIERTLTAEELRSESVRLSNPATRRRKSVTPMLFSTIIFVIAFLPLFTMRGVEGVIFSPMSHTYAYALGTAILLAVTLSPVLSSYFFAKGIKSGPQSNLVGHRAVLPWPVRARARVAAGLRSR